MTNDALQANEIRRPRFQLFRAFVNRQTLKWFGLLFPLILLLAYIALHVWIDRLFQHKVERLYGYHAAIQDPGMRKYYEDRWVKIREFWDTPIQFPDECFREPVRSKELDDLYHELFRIQMEIYQKKGWISFEIFDKWEREFYSQKQLSTSEWERFLGDIDEIDAWLRAGFDYAEQAEREMRVHSPGADFPVDIDRALLELSLGMRLKAIALMHEGRFGDAGNWLIHCFHLFLTNPYRNSREYWNGVRVLYGQIQGAIPLFEGALAGVGDAPLLRRWLDALNRLEPYLFQDLGGAINEIELIVALREIERQFKAEIDVRSGEKGSYYVDRLVRQKYRPIAIDKILSTMWSDLLTGKERSPWEKERFLIQFSRYMVFPQTVRGYQRMRSFRYNDPESYLISERRAGVQFDLLRLKIAAELFYEDTGKNPTQTGDLVPTYFDKDLKHRETGRPFLWLEGVPDEG